MTVTIYHNPRCSKSRNTLELIRAKGIEPSVVEYLKTPPSAAELEVILNQLGKEPREILRKTEAAYKEAGLDNASLSRSELIAAMAAYPSVIERPIVVANGKAALGRPPETVLDIL